jgi:hypothetical protein
MSARSTTETCRPELPSDRRNRIGQKPSKKKKGKIHKKQKRGEKECKIVEGDA